MYLPKHFAETDVAAMHALMRAHPLATVVHNGPQGLGANHLPLHLSTEPAPNGCLQGHVARANTLWKEAGPDAQVLVIFNGPEHYISPSSYASKARDGRVVPTWNYVAVHAHGTLRVIDDAAWVAAQMQALTSTHEAGRAAPWSVEDAPADYIERMRMAVVGIEIVVSRLEGKWKVSQNQPAENQESLVAALEADDNEQSTTMARLIRQRRRP